MIIIFAAVEKLYLVDNSEISDNGIKKYFINNKKIIYIENNSNTGVAHALNQGAGLAITDGYDWLLTLDQDSKPDQVMIESLVMFVRKTITI